MPPDAQRIDATGKTVVPGFIDSHTHLLFAGSREDEFEQPPGPLLSEISPGGGGIDAPSGTSAALEKGNEGISPPTAPALPPFRRYHHEGQERLRPDAGRRVEVSRSHRRVERRRAARTGADFLGHAVPPEFAHDRDGYLRLLLNDMLPEVARCRLAEFCDVFCETGVFSLAEAQAVLARRRGLGFGLKLHADELTPLGGAELAAQLVAVSADHLLCISAAGIDALAASDTVATLLPGTAFFLGVASAPALRLIERGAAVAVASDCNPGTCPSENLPLVGSMACTQMGMLPGEVVAALTLNAAAALGRSARLGSLEAGKQADVLVCDVPNHRQLFYHFGVNHVELVIRRQVVHAAGGTARP